MDALHIDHLGPFVKSVENNSYVIVVVDAFTKFVFTKAVPNTRTGPVIQFLNEIIEIFGVPRRIICDRGTAFTSKNFTEFCQGFGYQTGTLCYSYSPSKWTSGKNELFHFVRLHGNCGRRGSLG